MANRSQARDYAAKCLSPVRDIFEARGFSVRMRDGDLLAASTSGEAHRTVSILLKDFEPAWMFEVVFGINWRNVYGLMWRSRDLQPNKWKKVAIVSTGTPNLLEFSFARVTFRDERDVSRVTKELLMLVKDIGIPFFDEWSDVANIKHDFYELSPRAIEACLVPQECSMISVSIAILSGDGEIVPQLVAKNRAWLAQFKGRQLLEFDEFIEYNIR